MLQLFYFAGLKIQIRYFLQKKIKLNSNIYYNFIYFYFTYINFFFQFYCNYKKVASWVI